jgi:PadR family transcriptional regulator PadR
MAWPKEARPPRQTCCRHPRSDGLADPLHGYGIARWIQQISNAVLTLNEGTVYASLMRLQQRGWISASWGISDNNRKAQFYAITRSGRRKLTTETENWDRIAGVIARLRTAERP